MLWNPPPILAVQTAMRGTPKTNSPSTHLWIPIGSALFLIALAVSALVAPELRLLHLLQALIYIAIAALARRNNIFALGAGFTIAVAWNALEFFGPHLVQQGSGLLWIFLTTGQAQHLETMMVPIGATGHIILIVACLVALLSHTTSAKKWWKFFAGGVIVLAYFALIVVVARPR